MIPTHPDAITPDWLATTLGRPAGALRGFAVAPVGTGQMCDSFRLTLDWADQGDAPASIIAKCPSADPSSRDVAKRLGNYVLEVNWYRSLAGQVPVARPDCAFAAIDDNEVDFLLLLADLAPARQGDQLAGASAGQLGVAIDQAAALHGALWNSPALADIGWLHRDNAPIIRALFPTMVGAFVDRYTGRLDADCLALGPRIVDRLDSYLTRTPSAPTLVHGDLRVDNILFAPDISSCWVVDWQTIGIGSGATDVAYLVGTSIADPDERAIADRPAFDRWVDALVKQGAPADREALWTDYRIGALSGYFMAVFASMSVERTERGDEMFAVMAERPARQALALGSLDLL